MTKDYPRETTDDVEVSRAEREKTFGRANMTTDNF